jgi:hypothetical protein
VRPAEKQIATSELLRPWQRCESPASVAATLEKAKRPSQLLAPNEQRRKCTVELNAGVLPFSLSRSPASFSLWLRGLRKGKEKEEKKTNPNPFLEKKEEKRTKKEKRKRQPASSKGQAACFPFS